MVADVVLLVGEQPPRGLVETRQELEDVLALADCFAQLGIGVLAGARQAYFGTPGARQEGLQLVDVDGGALAALQEALQAVSGAQTVRVYLDGDPRKDTPPELAVELREIDFGHTEGKYKVQMTSEQPLALAGAHAQVPAAFLEGCDGEVGDDLGADNLQLLVLVQIELGDVQSVARKQRH